jgi:hypothetical protein
MIRLDDVCFFRPATGLVIELMRQDTSDRRLHKFVSRLPAVGNASRYWLDRFRRACLTGAQSEWQEKEQKPGFHGTIPFNMILELQLPSLATVSLILHVVYPKSSASARVYLPGLTCQQAP